MTAVDTELDILLLVDIDKEVSCEWRYKDECSAAAKWKATHSCCGYQVLYCDMHKKDVDDFFAQYGPAVLCKNCNHRGRVIWVKL